MSTSIHLIDGLARRAAHLYTLPHVAVRVLELTDQPQVDAIALRECIEKDPALTTKVLRVVNSSLFGLRRPVSNLSQALALLGTNPLKLLVLGFSLPTGLFSGVAANTLGWYWRRTLTKAVAARRLCEILGHSFADEAFVAALLQDLGMLLLIQELGAPYADLVEKARQHRCDLLALEVASLGFDHTTLTALLMADWGLPRPIIDSVAWEPGANLEAGLPAGRSDLDRGAPLLGSQNGRDCVGGVVHLAEWIARVLADGRADALDRVLDMGQRDYGLKPEQISELIASLQEEVAGLAEVLSLELSEGFDYRELLAAAHARLAEAAAEAAGAMLRAAASPKLAGEVRLVSEAAARWTHRSNRPVPAEASTESSPPPPSAGVALPARRREAVEASSAEGISPKRCATSASMVRGGVPLLEAHGARGPNRSAEVDRGLLGHLTAAALVCRQARCPLSLLLVELSQSDELVLHWGLEGFRRVRSELEVACRRLDHAPATCLTHGEAGFAVILKGCDRQLAVRLGNELIEKFTRAFPPASIDQRALTSISVGVASVALPPRNFPAQDLIQAASRCLYGSRSSGGGVVKSIEIY